MTTLVCDIDGCTHSLDAAGRGFMRMGAHRRSVHGLPASSNPPKPRRVEDDDHVKPDGETTLHEAVPARQVEEPGTETAPRRARRWGRFRRNSNKDTVAVPTRERAPKRTLRGKRVALDVDITDAWAFFGRRLEAGPHYPTGRMLQYQAPGAGVILDRSVAGTLLDTVVLQPLARSRDKYEDAAFVLLGPLAVFAITRTYQELAVAMAEDPERAAMLQRRLQAQFEGLDWILAAMLPKLAEGKKLAEEKAAKVQAVVADAFPELAGTGVSPAEALRDMLFAPPPVTGEGVPDGRVDSSAADDR